MFKRSPNSSISHSVSISTGKHTMMTRSVQTLLIAGAAAVFLFLWSAAGHTTQPAPQDTNPVMSHPDKFAWDIFVQINHPADEKAGRGIPDKTKAVGDPGLCGTSPCKVVWETWKNARNEIFLANGEDPKGWDEPEPKIQIIPMPPKFDPPKIKVIKEMDKGRDPDNLIQTKFDPSFDPQGNLNNETRMNKAAFEFVVNNRLHYVEGQECFHDAGKKIVFPQEAMEIKAQWRLLGDVGKVGKDVLNRYHWAVYNGKIFGLSGLHITTKDVPNWLWATFEQVDNPVPELPDVDRSGYPSSSQGRPLPPVLKNTKWEYYRLRGTNIDFTSSKGEITILANTQMEQGFQMSSSCISCHARATIGDKLNLPPGTFVPPSAVINSRGANRLTVFVSNIPLPINEQKPSDDDPSIIYGPVGPPDPTQFMKGPLGVPSYTQLDFVYALYRAKRRPNPPACVN